MKQTDCDIIYQYLKSRPGWNNGISMSRDLKPGCVNWAYRSRISEINKRLVGERIESRINETGCAAYRLVTVEAIYQYQYDEVGQYQMFENGGL